MKRRRVLYVCCVQDGGVGAVDDVTDSATVSPVDHHHQQQHEEQDNHGSTSVRNKPVVSIDHFTHTTCTCTCVVMDFSRLSLYCPYPMAFQWASRRFLKVLTEVASTTC